MEQDRKRLRKGGAVAVAVSGDAADYVNDFRRRYDPHVARILPHITLAVAPELDVCDWMPVRPRIKQALAQISPFTVHVAELGTFMDDLVLWLRPTAPHGELLTLRKMTLGHSRTWYSTAWTTSCPTSPSGSSQVVKLYLRQWTPSVGS